MKKVILLIAHKDFQSVEYEDAKTALEESGNMVITASDKYGFAVPANNHTPINVDVELQDIDLDDCDGFFIVGGAGAMECLDGEDVYKLARSAQEKDKLVGAICISPRILAKAGVLKGKKATGWDGDNELGKVLTDAGAIYVQEPVVVDGKIITANGPSSAKDWGMAIAQALK